ncbi:MAG: glycosyltransferase family 4 protein [Arcobacteraceae bacterium]|nr:glycosyltransferase family 4 protein [Arcobacteraceae bacterium]
MIYIILLILSFTLTFFIKNYAIKKSLVAQVNERSSHTIPTPHGGGIAIAFTWFIGIIYLYFNNEIESTLFYSLLVGVIISIISLFDDIYELSPKIRLLTQGIVAFCGLWLLGGLEGMNFGIFEITNPIITNTFAFFLIVWYINLYNFLDGINGYAGSEAIFLSVAGLILFGGVHFGILAVSVLGFLYWNWNRAKIFMGDVGSTLLGYNVAIFTIYYTNQESSNLWIWIILFGVFWFDATVTLIRRKLNGENLSQAHRKHLYQRLVLSGWSHHKVTNLSILVNLTLFIVVYFVTNIFATLIITMVILIACTKFVETKKQFK